ncbi:hypothetical protein [Marisediminicola sp. LYQ134]|uniref:hypothetical protein n=1 Tax=unclassified Marisediminicola TaxID=2618316 RepID=UPI0039830FC2
MNVVAFVIAAILFVGGILLFGYAWDGLAFDGIMFSAGLVAITGSIVIPFHILKRTDG